MITDTLSEEAYEQRSCQSDLSRSLKVHTTDQHKSIECTPYFAALKSCNLELVDYFAHLKILECIHSSVECAVAESYDARIRNVWSPGMAKTTELRLCLKNIESKLNSDRVLTTTALLLNFEYDIRKELNKHPLNLLGFMYVLNGSQIGGMIIRRLLCENFGAEINEAISYFATDPKDIFTLWNNFKQKLNALTLNEADRYAVMDAAIVCFELMENAFRIISSPIDRSAIKDNGK